MMILADPLGSVGVVVCDIAKLPSLQAHKQYLLLSDVLLAYNDKRLFCKFVSGQLEGLRLGSTSGLT